jgi:superfamily I DNA/RNA helicase
MSKFFDDPILNSPYAYPDMHWELVDGQPTEKIVANRCRAEIITPIPKTKKQETSEQQELDLSCHSELDPNKASIAAMHEAKGLEFRSVVVMACDDDILPLQERIEAAADTSELEEVYNTERHLLYVACTRARDHLLITGVDPASEFLDDFDGGAIA